MKDKVVRADRKSVASERVTNPRFVELEYTGPIEGHVPDDHRSFAIARRETPMFVVDENCCVVYQTDGAPTAFFERMVENGRLRPDVCAAVGYLVQKVADGTALCFAFVEPALLMRLRRMQGDGNTLFAIVFESFRCQDVMRVAVRRYGLTRREHEVLRWAFEGANASEIGAALAISEHTVQVYFKRLLRKTNARNRVAMVAQVLDWNAGPSDTGSVAPFGALLGNSAATRSSRRA